MTNDRQACTCGSDTPTSARSGHAHQPWCVRGKPPEASKEDQAVKIAVDGVPWVNQDATTLVIRRAEQTETAAQRLREISESLMAAGCPSNTIHGAVLRLIADKEAAEEQSTRMAVELGAQIALVKAAEQRLKCEVCRERGILPSEAIACYAHSTLKIQEVGEQLTEARRVSAEVGLEMGRTLMNGAPIGSGETHLTTSARGRTVQRWRDRLAALVDQKSPETPPG